MKDRQAMRSVRTRTRRREALRLRLHEAHAGMRFLVTPDPTGAGEWRA
ncbi:hypothetical protein [Propylenella binzhouense]|nr:hypothetical protein [Propylenella binzhouense]